MSNSILEKSQQCPQYLAVSLAGLLSIGSGIQLGWPSPSIPRLLSGELGFSVSSDEASYIILLSPMGYIIGSPLYAFLLDRIGRKYTLLAIAPVQIFSWITLIFSANVMTLCAAKIMMGVSDGGLYTAFPAYTGEVVEPKVRGVASNLTLGLLVGAFLINCYGSYLPIKTAAYISVAVPVLFMLTFSWMPESPYFLLAKNADNEARKSLKSLRRMENVDEELENIKNAVKRQMAELGNFTDIFIVKSNLKAFLILVALRTIQQFSGIFAIAYYMQVTFELADSVLSPQLSAILCSGLRIPLAFISSLMVDKIGRKVMLSVSSLGTTCSLAALATYFYFQTTGYNIMLFRWLPLVAMITFYIFCSIGLLAIPNLMMGELLPVNIKAKALAIMNIYFGLCISAASKLFQWTESRLGVYVPFFIFTAVCMFGIVFVYLFVPETKGKSLEEIQQILKGNTTYKTQEKQCEEKTITRC